MAVLLDFRVRAQPRVNASLDTPMNYNAISSFQIPDSTHRHIKAIQRICWLAFWCPLSTLLLAFLSPLLFLHYCVSLLLAADAFVRSFIWRVRSPKLASQKDVSSSSERPPKTPYQHRNDPLTNDTPSTQDTHRQRTSSPTTEGQDPPPSDELGCPGPNVGKPPGSPLLYSKLPIAVIDGQREYARHMHDTAVDSNDHFWLADSTENPCHIMGLCVVDRISLSDLRMCIQERWMTVVPKFQQVLGSRLGRPMWKYTPTQVEDMVTERYVVLHRLKDVVQGPCGAVPLEIYGRLSEMASHPLPPNKPLWRIELVHPVAISGQTLPSDVQKLSYICVQVHHGLLDGVSASFALFGLLFDPAAEDPESSSTAMGAKLPNVTFIQRLVLYCREVIRLCCCLFPLLLFWAFIRPPAGPVIPATPSKCKRPSPSSTAATTTTASTMTESAHQAHDHSGRSKGDGKPSGRKIVSPPAAIPLDVVQRTAKMLSKRTNTHITVNDVLMWAVSEQLRDLRCQEANVSGEDVPQQQQQQQQEASPSPGELGGEAGGGGGGRVVGGGGGGGDRRQSRSTSRTPAPYKASRSQYSSSSGQEGSSSCGGGSKSGGCDLYPVLIPMHCRLQSPRIPLNNVTSPTLMVLPHFEDRNKTLLSLHETLKQAKDRRYIYFMAACLICQVLPNCWMYWLMDRITTRVNTSVSNVVGPQKQYLLLGRPVHHAQFWQPGRGGITLSIAAMSMRGIFTVQAMADADELALFRGEFARRRRGRSMERRSSSTRHLTQSPDVLDEALELKRVISENIVAQPLMTTTLQTVKTLFEQLNSLSSDPLVTGYHNKWTAFISGIEEKANKQYAADGNPVVFACQARNGVNICAYRWTPANCLMPVTAPWPPSKPPHNSSQIRHVVASKTWSRVNWNAVKGALVFVHGVTEHSRFTLLRMKELHAAVDTDKRKEISVEEMKELSRVARSGGVTEEIDGSWLYHLLKDGWVVYGVDLQGHGLSSAWEGSRCNVERFADYADDIIQWLVAWKSYGEIPAEVDVFLAGLSLGGCVVTRACQVAAKSHLLTFGRDEPASSTATSAAARVRGLLLFCPAISAERLKKKTANRIVLPIGKWLSEKSPKVCIGTLERNRKYPYVNDVVAGDVLVYTSAIPTRLGFESVQEMDRIWPDIDHIHHELPVLLIQSLNDTMTDPEGSKRFIELISSKEKETLFLDYGWHFLSKEPGATHTIQSAIQWMGRKRRILF